jgi:branched-chain amino acid transport system substrate-binding protein
MKLAHRVAVFVLASALLAGATGCGARGAQTDENDTGEPIKIGAILSLTGTYAALGTAEKQALELEVARVNEAGGIKGRQIDLIVEDDATDEAKAVAAASKLIDQDGVVAILGASGTGQSMAVRGDITRAQVPQISMAGGTAITKEFDPYVFQTPWSNTIVVPFVLEAMKQAGITEFALMSDTGGYGKDGKPIVESTAAELGMRIVANETFNPGDTDMTSQLTKVRSAGAKAVLLWTAGKEAATIMKNAEGLGMRDGDGAVPFFGGSGQARLEFGEGAGAAGEGFTFGTGKSLVADNWGEGSKAYEVVSDFAQRYEASYGQAPDIFAGHAFDAFAIIVDAIEKAGPDADGAAIRDAIESTSGLVGFGGTFSFSPTDHNGLTRDDLAIYRFSGGTWEPVK